MFQGKWGEKDAHPPRYYGEPLYEKVIPKALAECDPDRPYIATSPIGGEGDCNQGGVGDQHNWDVWHGRGDWKHYPESTARFSSEYGFASSPNLDTWLTCLNEEDWDDRSDAVRWHDKTGKGYDTFVEMVRLHYPKAGSLEDWIYTSQLNQRDALRCAIEHYRRSEFCDGSLIWQLNDCWPVQSWAILDGLGGRKAAAFELERLYAPLLLSIETDRDEVRVHAVNQGGAPVHESSIELVAFSTFDGSRKRSWQAECRVCEGQRLVVLEGSVKGLPISETVLLARFDGVDAWKLLGEPKDARLQVPTLTASLSEEEVLAIHSDVPAIDIQLQDPSGDCRFVDNFVSVFPGVVKRVRISGRPNRLTARSLVGRHDVKIVSSPLSIRGTPSDH